MNKSIDLPMSNSEIKKHIATEQLKRGQDRRKIEDIKEAERIYKEFSLDY